MREAVMTTATATPEHLLVSTVLHSWRIVTDRIDKSIASLTDEQLQRQVAPGKNRIYYLLGHLTAVHDRLFPMLFLGERLHPELDEAFLTNPDKASADTVSARDLRKAWIEVNTKLLAAFEALPAADWLTRHEAVSA